jgi:hypothetical protein
LSLRPPALDSFGRPRPAFSILRRNANRGCSINRAKFALFRAPLLDQFAQPALQSASGENAAAGELKCGYNLKERRE